jgi:hypothetical protein
MRTHRSKKGWKMLPVLRAIGVLSAVGVVTSAVTFAALQSNGSALAGNTIQTATASLQISTQGSLNSFSQSVPGFNFTDLVPGGAAQPVANNYTVYLRNNGTAALKLHLSVPAPPQVSSGVDLSKVSVLLTPPNPGLGYAVPTQVIPLSSLIAGTVAVDSAVLNAGATTNFKIQVSMTADAVMGNSASITGLDLSFSGTVQ